MRLLFLGVLNVVLLSTAALADQCSSSISLLTNCGFETGTLAGWTVAGAQSSPAFQGITYGVDARDAHSGNYGAYVGAYGNFLSLAQSFTTTPGATYTVSYYLAQSPNTPSLYGNGFTATFDGATLSSLTNAPSFAFTLYQFTVTATTAISTLTFRSRDDTGFYSLDDVSVAAASVPEPATGGLLLVCLALTVLYAVRRAIKNG